MHNLFFIPKLAMSVIEVLCSALDLVKITVATTTLKTTVLQSVHVTLMSLMTILTAENVS